MNILKNALDKIYLPFLTLFNFIEKNEKLFFVVSILINFFVFFLFTIFE